VSPETFAYLLHAAAALSGLPALPLDSVPRVVQVPAAELSAEACRGEPAPCSHPRLVAFFRPEDRAVFALDDLDFDGDELAASVLVHEFVHALRYAQDPRHADTCLGNLRGEAEAYRVQNMYLRSHSVLYVAGGVLRDMGCE
jgi:hypothetical protein